MINYKIATTIMRKKDYKRVIDRWTKMGYKWDGLTVHIEDKKYVILSRLYINNIVVI